MNPSGLFIIDSKEQLASERDPGRPSEIGRWTLAYSPLVVKKRHACRLRPVFSGLPGIATLDAHLVRMCITPGSTTPATSLTTRPARSHRRLAAPTTLWASCG